MLFRTLAAKMLAFTVAFTVGSVQLCSKTFTRYPSSNPFPNLEIPIIIAHQAVYRRAAAGGRCAGRPRHGGSGAALVKGGPGNQSSENHFFWNRVYLAEREVRPTRRRVAAQRSAGGSVRSCSFPLAPPVVFLLSQSPTGPTRKRSAPTKSDSASS